MNTNVSDSNFQTSACIRTIVELIKMLSFDWTERHTSVIPALWKLTQKDQGFEASLDYTASPSLKINNVSTLS